MQKAVRIAKQTAHDKAPNAHVFWQLDWKEQKWGGQWIWGARNSKMDGRRGTRQEVQTPHKKKTNNRGRYD